VPQTPVYDAIILGAGAAGLFCAAVAGQRGKHVLVLERSAQPGKKILISGGGRCNFTNRQVSASDFLSANPHFAKSALARFTPRDFIALVEKHRIPYHEKTLGQLFCDGRAQEILDLLDAECKAGNVELRLGSSVERVTKNTCFCVETGQKTHFSTTLVVATGGLSIPKSGATGLGYRIAAEFGLKVEPPYPALVPLTFNEEDRRRWCDLAGVSADVTASFGKQAFREKMLVTHRGLSGPAILQLSSYWARPGSLSTQARAVRLDLLPETNFAQIVEERRMAGDRSAVKTILSEKLMRRLAERWLEVEGFNQPIPSMRSLEERLHAWTLIPSGTEGFEKAEVTGGGVSTADLDSRTLEARNVAGLFFVGEVVDVTGHLGGYNFQWAWSSAYAAAMAL
jgi:predicted Rossmann fold flavoprotein